MRTRRTDLFHIKALCRVCRTDISGFKCRCKGYFTSAPLSAMPSKPRALAVMPCLWMDSSVAITRMKRISPTGSCGMVAGLIQRIMNEAEAIVRGHLEGMLARTNRP